jgi:hypothetical protein
MTSAAHRMQWSDPLAVSTTAVADVGHRRTRIVTRKAKKGLAPRFSERKELILATHNFGRVPAASTNRCRLMARRWLRRSLAPSGFRQRQQIVVEDLVRAGQQGGRRDRPGLPVDICEDRSRFGHEKTAGGAVNRRG